MNTTKVTPLSVRSADDKTGVITGYASTFNNVDSYHDTIKSGAFTKSLETLKADGHSLPLLWEHGRDIDNHIGEIISAVEDETGLLVSAKFDIEEPHGLRAYKLAKGRRVHGLSIGFKAIAVTAGEINGEYVNVIEEADLKEISLVVNPADVQAQVTSVKSAMPTPEPEYALSAADVARIAASYVATPAPNTKKGSTTMFNKTVSPEQEMKELLVKAATAGRGLTAEERDHVQQLQAKAEEIKSNMAFLESLKGSNPASTSDDGDDYNAGRAKSAPVNGRGRLAVKSDDLRTKADQIVDDMTHDDGRGYGTKSIETTGTMTTSLMVSDQVVALAKPANSILEIIPTQVSASPTFSYMKQTKRVNRADVVETGALKPTSEYGFARVDEALQVVAHIAPGIDQYLLSDTPALSNFISSEMVAGVYDKVEGLIVDALTSADGAIVQAFNEDILTTSRSAVTQMQRTGLNAGVFIFNPDDWQNIELSKSEGSGQFVFGATPVNTIDKTLFSVPVVVSHRMPAGKAQLLDLSSATLYTDGQVNLAWNSSGEEFAHNQMTVRTEGRFKAVVNRSAGVVLIDTVATP